jgi:hypothetical protein
MSKTAKFGKKNTRNPHAFAIHNNMPKTQKTMFLPMKSFRG